MFVLWTVFPESRYNKKLAACGLSALPRVLKVTSTVSGSSHCVLFHSILTANVHAASRIVRALDAAGRTYETTSSKI